MDVVYDNYNMMANKYVNNWTLRHNWYNMSLLANWFHSVPHVDIRLHYLKNITFDPNDNEYLESLGILVAVPGFWLITTLLFFLIFFLCRCCDVNTKKKKNLTFCKLCLFLFAVISMMVITVGMFGSYLSHYGMIKVQNSTQDMSDVLETIKQDVFNMSEMIDYNMDRDVDQLTQLLDGPLVKDVSLRSELALNLFHIKRNVTKAIKRVLEINEKLEGLELRSIPLTIEKIEQIRWPSTLAVLATLVFVCLILIFGILKHSRCVLILFSVLGLLSLVICWVITSLYLGISVAGSDFCLDPKPFITKQFTTIDDAFYSYYVECDISEKKTTNPFRKQIRETTNSLEYIKTGLIGVERICHKSCDAIDVNNLINIIINNITKTEKYINDIGSLVDCERIHNDYIVSMSASCKDILEGLALMLSSAATAGVCFTILVLCASHTWINIRKKRLTIVDQAEETDPFLPPASSTSTTSSANSKRIRDSYGSSSSGRPRFSHTPPQTPHFPPPSATPPSNGRSLSRDDQLAFLSPPPAYEQLGHSHQAIGPHYVADTDLMMRATQATKF